MKDAIQDMWARMEALTLAERRAADAVVQAADAWLDADSGSADDEKAVVELALAVLAHRKAKAEQAKERAT